MGRVLVFLSLVGLVSWVVGCATSDITVYRMVDGKPVPTVQVEQGFSGKGCIAVDSATDGSASVIVQQAGTSDWSISRVVGFVGDIAGGVFGGTRSEGDMQGPSAGMQGCEGLFTSNGEDDEVKPEILYRANPVTYETIE